MFKIHSFFSFSLPTTNFFPFPIFEDYKFGLIEYQKLLELAEMTVWWLQLHYSFFFFFWYYFCRHILLPIQEEKKEITSFVENQCQRFLPSMHREFWPVIATVPLCIVLLSNIPREKKKRKKNIFSVFLTLKKNFNPIWSIPHTR